MWPNPSKHSLHPPSLPQSKVLNQEIFLNHQIITISVNNTLSSYNMVLHKQIYTSKSPLASALFSCSMPSEHPSEIKKGKTKKELVKKP